MLSTAVDDPGPGRRGDRPQPAALVRAAVEGDAIAVETLLTELLPRVRNLVRYFVRGDRDADDVAQDALVALLRGLPGYRGDGPFEAWADRVVAHAAISALRARKRQPASPGADASREIALVQDPGAPPDEYASRRSTVRLLDALPDEQRHALVLHHALGMSVPEVAAEVGAPLETVRSRLRLAKARCRQLLGVADAPADGGEE